MIHKNYLLYSAFFSFILFIVFTFFVLHGNLLYLDHFVDKSLPYSPGSLTYFISRFIAYLYFPLVGFDIALFLVFLSKKKMIEDLFLLLSFSGWFASEVIFKPIFKIACPSTYYSNIFSHLGLFRIEFIQKIALAETCYPSGHTTSYVVFFGYLGYLSNYIKDDLQRRIAQIVCWGIVFLVGPSRVYLHVHWVSDVIAAYFLGFSLLVLLIFGHKRYTKLILHQ